MDSNCDKCKGRCCVGIIDVYCADEIFYDDTLVTEDKDMRYDKVMRTNDKIECIALKDGKCNIYGKRPYVCREFKVGNSCCLNFQAGTLNTHPCRICHVSEAIEKAEK